MSRSRTATTTDEFRACLDKPLRKLRHILGRAHVKLPTLDIARQACIWLRRQFLFCDATHLLQRAQNDRRADAAVKTNDIRTPLIKPGKIGRASCRERV